MGLLDEVKEVGEGVYDRVHCSILQVEILDQSCVLISY